MMTNGIYYKDTPDMRLLILSPCPKCGGEDVVFTAGDMPHQQAKMCKSCGHVWDHNRGGHKGWGQSPGFWSKEFIERM